MPVVIDELLDNHPTDNSEVTTENASNNVPSEKESHPCLNTISVGTGDGPRSIVNAKVSLESKAEDETDVPCVTALDKVEETVQAEKSEKLFSQELFELLMHQMTQHVQLLAQSYLFNISKTGPGFEKITQAVKSMMVGFPLQVMNF